MAVARFVRSSPLGGVCAPAVAAVASVAVMAERVAPHNPLTANYAHHPRPPLQAHVLGTDHLGRDVLSRIIFGARVTLLVAISSVLLGDTIGFLWGVASGYLGGRVDLISQRVLDVLMSLPALILALLLMAALGAGLTTVIMAIAVTRVPLTSRVVRSMVLSVKELAYVEAARVLGAPRRARDGPPRRAPVRGAVPDHHHRSPGRGHLHRGGVELRGRGRAAAHAELGQHAGRRAGRGLQAAVVDGRLPRRGHHVTILAVNLFGDALRDFLDPKLR